MTPRTARLLRAALAVSAAAGLALLILAIWPFAWGLPPVWLIAAAAVIGVGAVWILGGLLRDHFAELRHLDIALRQAEMGEMPPEQMVARWSTEPQDEVGQLAQIVMQIAAGRAAERNRPDERLAAVIAALGGAVVVITESGQISLINAEAKKLLGEERAAIGTSIYAALDYDILCRELARAQAEDGPVPVNLRRVDGLVLLARIADFGAHRGAVLSFAAEVDAISPIEHALDMHDRPPAIAALPLPDTKLAELPVLVLDTETTGLDVTADDIVAIGAVRLHGGRIYRGVVLDRLVNPNRSIPARSSAVHGITDEMVADSPDFGQIAPDVRNMLKNCVLVGHNIGFDIAMLRRASAKAGQNWQDPPWLDVLLIAAALAPKERDLNLESIALRLGVNVSGRHTALGDALVTAEIYLRLLPRLEEQGVTTFGAAIDFCGRAGHVLAAQKAAGW